MPSKILTILLVLTILSINHLVDAGNKKGDSGGVEKINYDEPLTYRMKNWYTLIQQLERRLYLHYSGIAPLPPAGFELVNSQIGGLRLVFTGAQQQLDALSEAASRAAGRRFMR